MRIASVCAEACSGHSGHPKEKVSRHTVRPGTLGLTLELPVLTQTSQVANGQGGIDQRSIDGTDETMDSKASLTAIRAGD
jgi:hypothetical protein